MAQFGEYRDTNEEEISFWSSVICAACIIITFAIAGVAVLIAF
jgi:hypothetical protein